MGFVVLSRAGRLAHSWGSESHNNINIADHKVTTVWFYCLWYTGCGIGIMLWCVYDCYDPHCESLTPGYGGSVCCPSPCWLPLCVSALLGLLHLPSSDSLIFCLQQTRKTQGLQLYLSEHWCDQLKGIFRFFSNLLLFLFCPSSLCNSVIFQNALTRWREKSKLRSSSWTIILDDNLNNKTDSFLLSVSIWPPDPYLCRCMLCMV